MNYIIININLIKLEILKMEPILEQNQKLTIKKPNRNINNNEILSELINNLYISLKPGCPKNYNLPTNFVNLILRIISTNFNIIKNEENILLNSLLEKVYQISKNDEDVINQFQNLYDRLTQKRRLTKRWGVLYILNHFSNKNFNFLFIKIKNYLFKFKNIELIKI